MLHSIALSVLMGIMSLAAQPVPADGVRCWEDQLTLPTYGWEEDIHPVFQEYENAIYYPWTRQDYLTGVKKDRTYKTLNLENQFLRVTCIPELGGRIYSVFDKTTNQEMFHKNDVIKPALIAMRGAWISGGIEWNVGPQGHTVFIMEPTLARVCIGDQGEATLIVGATDKTFGTQSTFVLPVPGQPGSFIFLADRWKPRQLSDSRYVWLPLILEPEGGFTLAWRDRWDLSVFTPK